MSEKNQKRILALVLGLATITAGFFSWRAGQIGSTAAFDDRTSIGQTIDQQLQELEISLAAAADSRAYVRYLADYAEAAALEDQADELEARGDTQAAEVFRSDAEQLRRAATRRTADAGVFASQAVAAEMLAPTPEPRDFDLATHVEGIRAQVSARLTSPSGLDPQRWADESIAIRDRIRGLKLAVFFIVIAAALLTAAQLADRAPLRWLSGGSGAALWLVVAIITLATVY